MKKYFRILLSLLFIVLLQSCATTAKKPTSVHGYGFWMGEWKIPEVPDKVAQWPGR